MCSEADQIVAVPGAVAAGTTYKIGRVRLPGEREVADLPSRAALGVSKHVMSRTQLAVWLSFPSRHYTPWARNQGYILLGVAALVHLVVSLVIAMGQDARWGEVLLAPFCLTGLFWGLGLLNVLGSYGARKRDTAEAPAREKALAVWESLCYCARDNVVFEPGVGVSFHPSETREYIFGFRGNGR
ncbi:hypothetical protein FH608_047350 [Nonomuraea phyllanthi]|uniref:Uncharacterized protein n=1 Tax=Nonomuraea phyllanthi TaxID=2219224 RepID=A0A5C4V3Q7_9ACTN|nr:hypothetical protein [Nonomuraea phyllanthi]KAB8185724.1 hypothetical protein FH608_047350 [Nonomuraea phyllanthi]QFY11208.1 hypothetical protein GBF35_35575 [Nonomuraea phyllanthi]